MSAKKKRRGRPPRDDTAGIIVRVRMTPGQRDELRRVADENGTGMSKVIREAVDEFCADYRETSIFRSHKK